jgi:hypothetical protein
VPVAARIALALLDRRALQWLLWLIAGGLLLLVALFGGLAAHQSSNSPTAAAPSATAIADIPGNYLAAYQAAAAKYGLDWAILAGIGRVECDHGRDPDPSCTVPGAENYAGAGGPMQFLADSWTSYGVTPSGQPAPAVSRWNYLDAIYSAANLLRASGAPGNYYQAIYAYNHAGWYVAEVEQWAAKYRAAGATIAPAGSGTDPIPGFTIGRDDMGVDANAPVGTPIYAPADSQLVQVLNDWYDGQPLLLFRFLNPPAEALSPYWYVAEQITPVSTTIGTIFRARAAVARYAPCCTGIEIGWGSPTSNARTLADETDPGSAHPPAGAQTTWGESFKRFFGIP